MAMTGVMAGWLIVNADKALRDWGFVCENGRIVELAPNSKLAGRPGVADCRDSIVTPTFTNTHTHMYETIAHGAVEPNLSLKPLLEDFWWPVVENRQTLETIRLTAEYAALECLGSGVTLINDILEAPFAERGRRLLTEESVLRRAGMKAILSLESNERISTENGVENLEENRDFILAMRDTGSSDIRGTICTHTTFSCSVPFLKKAAGMAREMDEYIQIHMNEGPDECKCAYDVYGMTTAELYKKIGLGQPVLLHGARGAEHYGPDGSGHLHTAPVQRPVQRRHRPRGRHAEKRHPGGAGHRQRRGQLL